MINTVKKIVVVGAVAFGTLSFGVFAQATQCLDQPFLFSDDQKVELQDIAGNNTVLTDYFEKEYIVVEFYEESCSYSPFLANAHNSNTSFQDRVSGVSTCDYIALTRDGTLSDRLQQIGGMNSFVGARSRAVVDTTTAFEQVPVLYGSNEVEFVPTIMILNRKGEMVVTKYGGMPDLFDELCITDQVCAEQEAGIYNDEGGVVPEQHCILDNTEEDVIDDNDTGETDGGASEGSATEGSATNGESSSGSTSGGETSGGATTSGSETGGSDSSYTSGSDDGSGSNDGGSDGGSDSGFDSGGDGGEGDGSGGSTGENGSDDSASSGQGTATIEQVSGGSGGSTKVGKLQIDIPWENERDIVSAESSLQTANSKNSYRITIKLISQWVWIVLGAVAFIALVYGGLKIAFSFGKKESMMAGFNALMYAGIALVLAIASYVIVNLVVNLF